MILIAPLSVVLTSLKRVNTVLFRALCICIASSISPISFWLWQYINCINGLLKLSLDKSLSWFIGLIRRNRLKDSRASVAANTPSTAGEAPAAKAAPRPTKPSIKKISND